jgi:hypothetical protein
MNAAGELEGVLVELEDREAAEGVLVGIEDAVVINIVVVAEDPFAISLQVGLRRFAFDLVAQDFLLAVSVGDVELVEDKQPRGEARWTSPAGRR